MFGEVLLVEALSEPVAECLEIDCVLALARVHVLRTLGTKTMFGRMAFAGNVQASTFLGRLPLLGPLLLPETRGHPRLCPISPR